MIRCSHSFFVFGSRRIQHETFTLVVFLHFCWIVFRSTIGFQGSFGQYQNSLRHERGKVSNLKIDLVSDFSHYLYLGLTIAWLENGSGNSKQGTISMKSLPNVKNPKNPVFRSSILDGHIFEFTQSRSCDLCDENPEF